MDSSNYVNYEDYFTSSNTTELNKTSQYAFAIGPNIEVIDLLDTQEQSIAEVLDKYKERLGLPSRVSSREMQVINADTNTPIDLYTQPIAGVTYTFIYYHDAKGNKTNLG